MKNTFNFPSRILPLFFLLFFYGNLSAQTTSIAFCDNLRTIEPELGNKISFFSKYNDFQQATLTKEGDRLVLSITYKDDGVFQTEKRTIEQSQVDDICQEITLINSSRGYIEEDMSTEGNRRLIISSTIFSLGLYGWGIPVAFGAENYKTYTASYLLVGGGGFFIPFLATRKKDVSMGMAWGYTYGAGVGALHGMAFSSLINSDKIETQAGLSVGFSVTESLLGYFVAKNRDYSWGRVSSMGSGGIWGLGYGALLPMVFTDSENISSSVFGASMLTVSGAGMFAGNYLYSKNTVTPGDVVVINSLGLVSSVYPFAIGESLDIKSDQLYVALTLLGSTVGLAGGVLKTKNYNYSRQQGNIIAIGEVSGGLVGIALAVLADASFEGYLWAGAIGGTAGFFVTDFLVKDSFGSQTGNTSGLNFHINPYGILGAFDRAISPFKPWDPRYNNSIVNLNLTF